MTFNINIDHLEEAISELNAIYIELESNQNDMSNEMKKLFDKGWSGESQKAFNTALTKWNLEMTEFLSNIKTYQSNFSNNLPTVVELLNEGKSLSI